MTERPFRHDWFQSADAVTVSVLCKERQRSACAVEFEPRRVLVRITPGDAAEPVTLEFDLAHEIVPEQCSYKLMSTKIEVLCAKAQAGLQWGALEGVDPATPAAMQAVGPSAPPAYPSSSRKKTDFTQIEREAEKDKESENALNELFQKIYRDGSEETRRAMVKSFVESGGTTLSTNWDEVKKGSVEVRPPEGMEAKGYES